MQEISYNSVYSKFFQNQQRFAVLRGGAGSGKSHAAAQKVIYRCLAEPGLRVLCVRSTYRSLKDSCYADLLKVLQHYNANGTYRATKQPLEMHFLNGSAILFRGTDDPEKLKSISDIHVVWIEEANQIKEEAFSEINRRVRVLSYTHYKQIILTFNPVSRENWIYYAFYAPGAPYKSGSYKLKTTYLDNAFVSDDYRKELERDKLYNPTRYNVYALGEWGHIEGLVYHPFQISSTVPGQNAETIYGVDFGYNDPTTLVRIITNDSEYYCTDLLYKSELTNQDFIKKLKELKISKSDYIYCDSAEPDRIKEIQQAGYNAKPAYKAKNSVYNGIDWIKSNQENIYFTWDADYLFKESQIYAWKEKNGIAIDEPLKSNDHALDAMRYALYTHYGKKKKVSFKVHKGPISKLQQSAYKGLP